MPMRALRPLLFLTLLALPALLSAQTPVGRAIEVGVASPIPQGVDVAMSPQGDFVVGWVRVRTGKHHPPGVFCRLYTAAGSPRTGEIRVNGSRSDSAFTVRLAMMDDGSFVAVFPTRDALLAQRFTAGGAPVGGNLVVTRDPVTGFEVASRGDGSFMVTWVGGFPGVAARAFGADGQALGPQVPVVVAPTGGPRLAVRPAGSFLVVWLQVETTPAPNGHNYFVQGRLFNADGTPLGESFLVSEKLPEDFFMGYDTAVDSNGNFLVTWLQSGIDPAPISAFVRPYAPDGSPLGGASLAGHQPAGQEIAAGPDGDFASVWQTLGLPFTDVVVNQSATNGASLGPPVVLNPNPYKTLTYPVLAGNGEGSFVAAWFGKPRGGTSTLIVRRFRTE
jgi:large repetitive protein